MTRAAHTNLRTAAPGGAPARPLAAAAQPSGGASGIFFRGLTVRMCSVLRYVPDSWRAAPVGIMADGGALALKRQKFIEVRERPTHETFLIPEYQWRRTPKGKRLAEALKEIAQP